MEKVTKLKARQSAYKLAAISLPISLLIWLIGVYGYAMGNMDVDTPTAPFGKEFAVFLFVLLIIICLIRYRVTLKKLQSTPKP